MSKWCVFISGTGSNLRALLDMRSTFNIAYVVSNKAQALGLVRAQSFGIRTDVLTAEMKWEDFSDTLEKMGITHIFLAGFMKIIPSSFIEKWKTRIYNIHPSLLPLYPGLKSIEKSFSEQSPLGLTLHEVTEGVDEGPVVSQRTVARLQDLESSELLIHIGEHQAVRTFACTKI